MNKIKIFQEQDVEKFIQKCYKIDDVSFIYLSKTYTSVWNCDTNTFLSYIYKNQLFAGKYKSKHFSISKQIILNNLPKKDLLKFYEEN